MATKGNKVVINTTGGALNPDAVPKKPDVQTHTKQKPSKEYKDTVSEYGNKIGRPRVDEDEKKKNCTLTIHPSMHKDVMELAKRKHKSFSQVIADAVEEYLAKESNNIEITL